MSKKKIVNLIELIIQIIFLVSTCTVQSIIMTGETSSSTLSSTISVWTYTLTESNPFAYIAFALMLINVILCLVSIFGNSTDKDSKLHVAIPIANIFFTGWILVVVEGTVSGWLIEVNSAYKVFGIICLLAIAFLSIAKRGNRIAPKENQSQQVINNIQEASNADELKKFKDLLDSGVITQEEFDAKKKQLLDL